MGLVIRLCRRTDGLGVLHRPADSTNIAGSNGLASFAPRFLRMLLCLRQHSELNQRQETKRKRGEGDGAAVSLRNHDAATSADIPGAETFGARPGSAKQISPLGISFPVAK